MIVSVLLGIMMYYCGWLTLLLLLGVVAMVTVSRKVGGGSARYFVRQQAALGHVEGYIQEMMNGQRVVKVFCHEEESKAGFDELNDALYLDSRRANTYANMLGPIIFNIGNVLYVLVALVGGLLSWRAEFQLGMRSWHVVPFLNMTCGYRNINLAQRSGTHYYGLAGADRVFPSWLRRPRLTMVR